MQQRQLGKTGHLLSVVGFGGIIVMNEEPDDAARFVARAIERGINYFDVAPTYGNAEERLGLALAPYRKDVFLACKTGLRDRAGTAAELQRSLERLQTDHLDLYQFHGVTTLEEVEQIFASDGAMWTFLEARESGLIGHIGFSAHTEEAALAMLARFPFDTILFPINWRSWHQGHFGARVVARAVEMGVGILALKTLGLRRWLPEEERKWKKTWYKPIDDPQEALLAARFTLSRPITAAVAPGQAELLWLLCDAVEQFTPLTEEEEAHLAQIRNDLPPVFCAESRPT